MNLKGRGFRQDEGGFVMTNLRVGQKVGVGSSQQTQGIAKKKFLWGFVDGSQQRCASSR